MTYIGKQADSQQEYWQFLLYFFLIPVTGSDSDVNWAP